MSKKYWTTQSGEILRIRDIKTNHIKNCIKAIQRGDIIGTETDEYVAEFEEELAFRKYIKKIIGGEFDE